MKESDIQNQICDYLALKHLFFWRQNTAPTFQKDRQCFRRMPKYSLKGVSDIILILDGVPWFIEVKRPKTYQSPEQKKFQSNVEANGGIYKVVRGLDDVIKLGF